MLVIPALDLRGGRLVRLWQGDYEQETVYGDDPVAVARAFAGAGAPRLHVVDLDGARAGRPVHRDLILRLVASVPVPVQVGGGIRDAATAADYLEGGAAAVIFGTVAVRRPDVVAAVAARYPGRVLVSLDLKDGQPALEGWTATDAVRAAGTLPPDPPDAGRTPAGPARPDGPEPATGPACPASSGLATLLARWRAAGVMDLIVTDTRRDGTLAGVDPAVFRPFLDAGFRVIAAGGVRDVDDVRKLRDAGLQGVIAGRALYEGTLDLTAALAVASGEPAGAGDRPAVADRWPAVADPGPAVPGPRPAAPGQGPAAPGDRPAGSSGKEAAPC
ncbi:histidine biosynthesis protein [Thermaerobacter marianensis DSM 12885]|uniref:1-(5-phosphoribosyl)-5-[(5-phosphoribosylamino)methylideneamino] imidazole-4-carboxamide isomerase n=1 Tax=Thermaerobacter marianensis (strain ATCC 700841 / DSM 12885 / JCM 10246 / 7p75a) TaxID=644966 RepID=E6SHE9_THEM7|nr:HisA/HisF-related TIM barrel protein [Thermaerobacter marianensis]ADU50713.1 histidine biosynthesis protein [Thermaerobacter marianensis DSM 12885]